MKAGLKPWLTLGSFVALALATSPVRAVLLASDDASQATYNTDWTTTDNGGTGFAAWSTLGQQNPGTGSGGTFLSSGSSQNHIGTGGSPGKAFGLFGNGGGVGHAIRSFSTDVNVGEKFSIDVDNGFIDSGGTVGFGLRNASGNNLVEFYFKGGQSNYKVNRSGGEVDIPSFGFTNEGLRITIQLTDADTFTLTADKKNDGFGVNVASVTGDLINAAGGQVIRQLRLFNANAGFNSDHDTFYNSFSLEAVPEASAVAFFGVAMGVTTAATWFRRKRIPLQPMPA